MNKNPQLHASLTLGTVRRLLVASLITIGIPPVIFAQATKVTSAAGRYTAAFPAIAERKADPPQTENGLTYSTEVYTALLQNQMFSTVFTTYSGGTINTDKELQANVDNFVKGVSATLLTNKPTAYTTPWINIRGTEFTCETAELTFHGKFFVEGNDVWGILYGARKEAASEAAKDQFFRSLEINTARPKGEHSPQ